MEYHQVCSSSTSLYSHLSGRIFGNFMHRAVIVKNLAGLMLILPLLIFLQYLQDLLYSNA